MAITINGSGITSSEIADGTITTDDIASGVTGKVLQIVNYQTGAFATGTTTIVMDNTIPQNTEGNEWMTLSITPTSATSKLRIDVVVYQACSASETFNGVALFQDSTANALASSLIAGEANAERITSHTFSHTMTSGTTSETTFKVRGGYTAAGTASFNGREGSRLMGGVMASSITITEYEV